MRKLLRWIVGLCVFVVSAGIGAMAYFHFGPPEQTCRSCHEMHVSHAKWASSAHGQVHCRSCHGGSLTLDVHALQEHVNRVVAHFSEKKTNDQRRLSEEQVLAVSQRCQACHQTEYAGWLAGGHSVTYKDIFLNEKHNQTELLGGDCLRCHGMFFEGQTQDLVSPISTQGPWKLTKPQWAAKPAVPCLACHQVHTEALAAQTLNLSDPRKVFEQRKSKPVPAALYSRHEKTHFAAAKLPMPAMFAGEKPLNVSQDPRQRLCLQCHAPNARHIAGSSDDRTPTGVHEGISCATCHRPHSNDARPSCAQCHPKMSNCGLDVEKMDTTYLSSSSKHNIHFVACGDCHADKNVNTAQRTP